MASFELMMGESRARVDRHGKVEPRGVREVGLGEQRLWNCHERYGSKF